MGAPTQRPPNVNSTGTDSHTFDAIVIGSGISGGWAAKELCEKGLKTLVVERGRNIVHVKDYDTAFKNPWDFPHRLRNSDQDKADNPIQSTVYDEASKQFFVSDKEHPYVQANPFHWIRGYQLGGRSLTWGRQCYRLSDLDFGANLADGHGVDWPIRYKDIAPWYDYVEQFVGISGQPEGLAQLPDGQFLPPMEMNCAETQFSRRIRQQFPERVITIARVANLTQGWKGRGPCQFRNLCMRGCPFSGYFSSNAATLPAAQSTGNLTLLTDAIVIEVLYDEASRKAEGVRVMDQHTHQVTEYFARIIFINASTIATAALLLGSVSSSFPSGLGNSSGQVGHNLMDHHTGTGGYGILEGFEDQYYSGRRPAGFYVPRFVNIGTDKNNRSDYVRGFGYQGIGIRQEWTELTDMEGFGQEFKEKLLKPGPWQIWMGAYGETLPYFDNHIQLSKDQKDQWGLPLVKIHFEYQANELAMRKDEEQYTIDMMKTAGLTQISTYRHFHDPGSAVHEMGTVRMGKDPRTSVLNGYNQMHDVPNVFITDGSCMPSSAWQNPSLTYMALTARACDYALSELKAGRL
jgi:choline dehydrogenase-like flavoprotein